MKWQCKRQVDPSNLAPLQSQRAMTTAQRQSLRSKIPSIGYLANLRMISAEPKFQRMRSFSRNVEVLSSPVGEKFAPWRR